MGLILDMDVAQPEYAPNLAFYRKITRTLLNRFMVGRPYSFYDFQDDPTLVGADNKGSSGFLGNMGWSNIGLRTADGWYRNNGKMLQAGMTGFGMFNNGGISGYEASVIGHSGNDFNGTNFSIIFVIKPVNLGEANQGRILQKTNNMDAGVFCDLIDLGGDVIHVDFNGNEAYSNRITGLRNYWHLGVISYDGTQPFGARCRIYVDGFDRTDVDFTEETVIDDGNPLYILDNFANVRAFNGGLGLLAILPGKTLSLAEVELLSEIATVTQATAGNRPNIITPGMWHRPEYNFVRTESDHLLSYQIAPLLTEEGSVMIAFTPEDVANSQNLFGISDDGNAVWTSLGLQLRGDIANDPLELIGYDGGVADLRLSIPFGAGRLNVPSVIWFTSDGSTVRGYVDGREQVVTPVLGANTGQWWISYPNANVCNIGAERHDIISNTFDGRIAKILNYDRAVNYLEIQKHFAANGRWYPKS